MPRTGEACPLVKPILSREVKETFDTSVGPIDVRIDHDSRTVAVYRFDEQRRVVAAAIESWDYADLSDVFARQIGLPPHESDEVAAAVRTQLAAAPPVARLREWSDERPSERSSLVKASVLRRCAAVLIDGVIVFFPLSIVLGLMYGGGYVERTDDGVYAGVDVTGAASWLLLVLWIAYYVFGEALTGGTIGKGMVRIRVVDEHGEHPTLRAAVVRNVLRPIDGIFFYLVGAILALSSPLGQRLGDRAAHTVVVRR
jgi:uncharacterized RDD family membrane protein YckC